MVNYFIANEQYGDAGSYARSLANETSELGLTDLYGYVRYLLGKVFYLEQNYLDAKESLSEAFKIYTGLPSLIFPRSFVMEIGKSIISFIK